MTQTWQSLSVERARRLAYGIVVCIEGRRGGKLAQRLARACLWAAAHRTLERFDAEKGALHEGMV